MIYKFFRSALGIALIGNIMAPGALGWVEQQEARRAGPPATRPAAAAWATLSDFWTLDTQQSEAARRRVAQSIIEHAAIISQEDAIYKVALGYFIAQAEHEIGNDHEAIALAKPIAADKSNINAAAAIRLLDLMGAYVAPQESADWTAHNMAVLHAISSVLPGGGDDDEYLHQDAVNRFLLAHPSVPGASYFDVPPSRIDTTTDAQSLIKAAHAYIKVRDYTKAAKVCRYVLACYSTETWFSPGISPIWNELGEAYLSQGDGANAVACFVNSIASGSDLMSILPRLRAADVLARHPIKVTFKVAGDPKTFIDIAKILLNNQYYEDAADAARMAEAAGDKKSAGSYLRLIYKTKAEWIGTCISRYGEGGFFRGTAVTRHSIAEAEEKEKEFAIYPFPDFKVLVAPVQLEF